MKRSDPAHCAKGCLVRPVSWVVLGFLLGAAPANGQDSRPASSVDSRPASRQSRFDASKVPQHEWFRSRFGPDKEEALRNAGATGLHARVTDGLEWLSEHQDADGHWDALNFMKHDPGAAPCDGSGHGVNDIGITSLALLAFLGDGNTLREGAHTAGVQNAVKWLQEQQAEDGLFGTMASHEFVYGHALATLAMCEAHGLSGDKALAVPAQKGVDWILRARNPYKVWRYFPRDGDNDTSVTGWMVVALKTAEAFRLKVDDDALKSSLLWFDQVTDPATGRAGYTKRGEGSSRKVGMLARFPASETEALTGVALLCRFLLGQQPKTAPVMTAAADALLKKMPAADADGSLDLYHWCWGSLAMHQAGGAHWTAWRERLQEAVASRQRKDGSFKGSWDPADPWGEDGGRVYSTALVVLCLESPYRYGRIRGTR